MGAGGEREEILAGGVANAGAVVRVGDTVRRPSGPFAAAVEPYLERLRAAGFDGAPVPAGRDEVGRSVFGYLPGEVPVLPYPAWALTEEALASVARLLRRFHEASARTEIGEGPWSRELTDPLGGTAVMHNDVCPENVVFRDGEAVALVDFDFAAPGRRGWDVVATAGMWCPVGDPSTFRDSHEGLDPIDRLRVFLEAYGLDAVNAPRVVDLFLLRREVGRGFILDRIARGEEAFIEMDREVDGANRYRKDLAWLQAHRAELTAAAGG